MKNKIENIVIMRLGTSNFGKIGTYNVQEVGLAEALIKKGYKVNVLYLNRPTETILQDEIYDYVYYLPHKHIGLHGIFDVKLLENYNPDFLILFSDSQLWSKNVIEWCEKKGIKCVHYFGNVLSDNPKWLHQFYTKLILMRNKGSYKKSINIAKTKKVKLEMESLGVRCDGIIPVGLDETILKPNVNLDTKIREELGYSSNELLVLFVGRITGYKKPIMACQIVEELRRRGNNAKLIMIGKGPLETELFAYIKEHKLEGIVNYVGRVPYEEMYKYYVSCDCLINLSAQEIFGMTILEAMYYAIPVVAHTAPGPNDIIENGVNGIVLNDDAIYVWCESILSSVNYRKKLGDVSRNNIIENYMWNMISDKFIKCGINR